MSSASSGGVSKARTSKIAPTRTPVPRAIGKPAHRAAYTTDAPFIPTRPPRRAAEPPHGPRPSLLCRGGAPACVCSTQCRLISATARNQGRAPCSSCCAVARGRPVTVSNASTFSVHQGLGSRTFDGTSGNGWVAPEVDIHTKGGGHTVRRSVRTNGAKPASILFRFRQQPVAEAADLLDLRGRLRKWGPAAACRRCAPACGNRGNPAMRVGGRRRPRSLQGVSHGLPGSCRFALFWAAITAAGPLNREERVNVR